MKPKISVGFQGELGAFSQQAITQFLGPNAKPTPYQRFDQVFGALAARKVQAAALPVENTLYGSIHENYDLLLKSLVRRGLRVWTQKLRDRLLAECAQFALKPN